MTAVAAPRRHRRTGWQLIGHLARRATMMEVHAYQSIYRFVFRRPRVPAGAVAFAYHQPVFAILIVFVVLSAVELVVVDVIVHRWPLVRIPILVVGIWGLVYMLGLLFGMVTRPHAVGPDGIRVRSGAEVDLDLPWAKVQSVDRRRDVAPSRQPKITVDDEGRATLHLRMQNETNLEIALERPTAVRLPQGTETIESVHLYAESPKEFLAEVRRHL